MRKLRIINGAWPNNTAAGSYIKDRMLAGMLALSGPWTVLVPPTPLSCRDAGGVPVWTRTAAASSTFNARTRIVSSTAGRSKPPRRKVEKVSAGPDLIPGWFQPAFRLCSDSAVPPCLPAPEVSPFIQRKTRRTWISDSTANTYEEMPVHRSLRWNGCLAFL